MKFKLMCLALVIALTGCTRIGPGHVGIVVSMAGSDRGVTNTPTTTGWTFYNPFSENVIEYPTSMQTVMWSAQDNEGDKNVDDSVTFTNKDAMSINADVSLNYTLDPAKVPQFYVKFLATDISTFNHGYLHTVVRNCLNESAGQYSVEDIMGAKKQEFLETSRECVAKMVSTYGVIIDPNSLGILGAPRPPAPVLANINAKIQAEQIALQKQNELLQVQADAAKQVAAAEGQAKAQIAAANGEAEANRIRTASITPVILQNKALDNQHDMIWRWNGQSPNTVIGDGKNVILQLPKTE